MSMTEIWRDIKDYEGLYQVSNLGRVKSLGRYVKNNLCGFIYMKEHILKQGKQKNGYKHVGLSKDGKTLTQKVHRLVAMTFPDLVDWTDEVKGKPFNEITVNHKDQDKTNNCVDNLEWCTMGYQINYGDRNDRIRKVVQQFTKDNTFVAEYGSLTEASKATNISCGNISSCCRGKLYYKTAGGYIWKYA